MTPFTDSEMRQLDAIAERRVHHEEFVARKPEYLDIERMRQWTEMRNTLIRQEHKALNRRFDETPAAVSAFGVL